MYNVIKTPPHGGKTTKALELVASELVAGKVVLLVNTEEYLESLYNRVEELVAELMGTNPESVDLENLYVLDPAPNLRDVQEAVYANLNGLENAGIKVDHVVCDTNIDHEYFKLLAENRGVFVTYTVDELVDTAE